eukprot:1966088-Rhodomonas_salina.1
MAPGARINVVDKDSLAVVHDAAGLPLSDSNATPEDDADLHGARRRSQIRGAVARSVGGRNAQAAGWDPERRKWGEGGGAEEGGEGEKGGRQDVRSCSVWELVVRREKRKDERK